MSPVGHIPLPASTPNGFLLDAGSVGLNEFANRTLHQALDQIAAPWREGTVNATLGYPPLTTTGGYPLANTALHENFYEGLVPERLVVLKQKGSQPGMVDIVSDVVDGVERNVLRLSAMANRDPSVDPNSWWVSQGALMQSASIFASGRFSIRAKFAPIEGLVFALWTFHEEEHRDAAHLPNGEVDPQFVDGATGWSTRLNHEIDIEIPASCSGLCATSATGTCAGQFDTANLNTYVFSNSNGGGNGYANLCVRAPPKTSFVSMDGEYHTYAFEWHTGSNATSPPTASDNCTSARVDFFLDDVYIATNDVFVPSRGSRFVFGVWAGGAKWSGSPASDGPWGPSPTGVDERVAHAAFIAEVDVCPFLEPGDAMFPMMFDQPTTPAVQQLWMAKSIAPVVPGQSAPSGGGAVCPPGSAPG